MQPKSKEQSDLKCPQPYWTLLITNLIEMANNLTEEQIEKYKQAFSPFDLYNTGTILIQDLAYVFLSLGQSRSEAELQDMVNEIECDGTGIIHFCDFLSLVGICRLRDTDDTEELLEAFKNVDLQGSGFIKEADFRIVIASLEVTLTQEEIDEIVREAEKSNDGEINYSDALKVAMAK